MQGHKKAQNILHALRILLKIKKTFGLFMKFAAEEILMNVSLKLRENFSKGNEFMEWNIGLSIIISEIHLL